jgi:hypothetical protein
MAQVDEPSYREGVLSTLRPDLAVVRPADWRALLATAIAGVGFDLAIRSGGAGVAGATLAAFTAAALLLAGSLRNPQAVVMAITAPVFGVWVALRASPWLLIPDMAAAGGLLVIAASLGREGSVLDLGPSRLLSRAFAAVAHGLAGPSFVVSAIAPHFRPPRLRSLFRLAVVVLPVLVLLGWLLASADVIFASLLHIRLDLGAAGLHLVWLVIGAWGMAGLIRLASARHPEPNLPLPDPPVRPMESLVTLGGMVLLYAAFAGAQVFALSSGGRRILETAGLTYAEYARSGFFQLVAVAAITVAVILGLGAATDLSEPRHRRWFKALALAATALTVSVVVVAVRRMELYESVFGLTMLRLYVEVACVCLGAALLLLGMWLVASGGRGWLLPGVAAIALAALLGLNVANPEAIVVRHNVAHFGRTGRLDTSYLSSLSADALPAAAQVINALPERARIRARRALCSSQPDTGGSGWPAYNLSRERAAAARLHLCGR